MLDALAGGASGMEDANFDPASALGGQPAQAPMPPMPQMGMQRQLPPVQRPPVPKEVELLTRLAGLVNVADDESVTEDMLGTLVSQVYEGYTRDLASRSDWEDIATRAMETAKQTKQDKNYPFPNAANVKYPLIATAALNFNARAYPAICDGRDVCRAKVGGGDPQGQKANRASRVGQFISHQVVDGIPAWEHEVDVMTYQLPILGAAFKKAFWNEEESKPDSKLISAFNLIVHNDTRDIETCPRISHRFPLYPYQIEERERAGLFSEGEADEETAGDDDQEEVLFIEQHCYFDLDGDGYAEPWIVTISVDQQKLVRIVAGFDPLEIVHDGEKIIRIPREGYFAPFSFIPNPEGGFYGYGFGHLLESFTEVINSSFNQMLDAGHLQSAGGGFVGSGLDFQSEQEEFRFEPGKYYTVTAEAGDIKNNLVTIDHPGPSPVLFQLLGMMMDSAKQITGVQDILTGAASAQTMQPSTLMALIDQGLKVFTAIYKRIYNGLSYEFRIFYRLNRKHLTDEAYNKYLGTDQPMQPPMQPQQAMQGPAAGGGPGMQNQGLNGAPMQPPMQQQFSVAADFADDSCMVTPVADPNQVTRMQQMAVAGFLLSLLDKQNFNGKLNPDEVLQRVLMAGGIDNIEKLLLPPPQPTPADKIPILAAMADIHKKESEAAHNFALAGADSARGQHFQARSADLIMGHQPDFYNNPGQ